MTNPGGAAHCWEAAEGLLCAGFAQLPEFTGSLEYGCNVASREEGANLEAIAAMLAHCGFGDDNAAALIEEARTNPNATRLRRGLGRVALGGVVAAGGVGLSFGLSAALSGWTVAFWGLVLVGLFQIGKGVQVLVTVGR